MQGAETLGTSPARVAAKLSSWGELAAARLASERSGSARADSAVTASERAALPGAPLEPEPVVQAGANTFTIGQVEQEAYDLAQQQQQQRQGQRGRAGRGPQQRQQQAGEGAGAGGADPNNPANQNINNQNNQNNNQQDMDEDGEPEEAMGDAFYQQVFRMMMGPPWPMRADRRGIRRRAQPPGFPPGIGPGGPGGGGGGGNGAGGAGARLDAAQRAAAEAAAALAASKLPSGDRSYEVEVVLDASGGDVGSWKLLAASSSCCGAGWDPLRGCPCPVVVGAILHAAMRGELVVCEHDARALVEQAEV